MVFGWRSPKPRARTLIILSLLVSFAAKIMTPLVAIPPDVERDNATSADVRELRELLADVEGQPVELWQMAQQSTQLAWCA